MADKSIIKEFLVQLGFKTDEPALKNFGDGITKATRAVVGLATAVEATAIAVSAGIARYASNLERLYFAARRTDSTAAGLKALDRAMQDFGTSAGDAINAAETLGSLIRRNPANEGLLHSINVQTRDAKGNLIGMDKILVQLGKSLAGMERFRALQYADLLGVPENSALAIMDPGFEAAVDRHAKLLKNVDYNKAAKDAHGFMNELRNLTTLVEAFGAQIYDALAKRLGMNMEQMSAWLQKNGPKMADRIIEVLEQVMKAAEVIGKGIVWLIDKLIDFDKATDGWSTKLLGGLAVLKLFGGADIIAGILKLAGALLSVTAGGGAMAGALGMAAGALGIVGAGAAGVGLGALLNKYFPDNYLAQFGTWLGGKTYDLLHGREEAMMAFQGMGWTKEQAAGIVANLQAESALNPNATGDHGQAYGVAQWHKERQEAFKRWAGFDMRDQRATQMKQFQFVDYEMRHGDDAGARRAGLALQATHNARQAGEIMSRLYERPSDDAGSVAHARGGYAANLAQTNNYFIDGSKSPQETAKEVARAQDRTNQAAIRNLTARAY